MSKRHPYPSDLTDDQWSLIRPFVCPRRLSKVGHPVAVSRRDLVDAIFYLLRTGCQWRQLPHDFPPWGTVSCQFCRWRKAGEGGAERGYDAGKKVSGRKRHLVVDTLGLLIAVVVHAANIQDQDGAKEVLRKAKRRFPRLQLLWADSAYERNDLPTWAVVACNLVLDIVRRA